MHDPAESPPTAAPETRPAIVGSSQKPDPAQFLAALEKAKKTARGALCQLTRDWSSIDDAVQGAEAKALGKWTGDPSYFVPKKASGASPPPNPDPPPDPDGGTVDEYTASAEDCFLRNWLVMVARRDMITEYRKWNERRRALHGAEYDPSDPIVQTQLRMDINECLRMLSADDQAILRWSIFDGRKGHEIGELLFPEEVGVTSRSDLEQRAGRRRRDAEGRLRELLLSRGIPPEHWALKPGGGDPASCCNRDGPAG